MKGTEVTQGIAGLWAGLISQPLILLLLAVIIYNLPVVSILAWSLLVLYTLSVYGSIAVALIVGYLFGKDE